MYSFLRSFTLAYTPAAPLKGHVTWQSDSEGKSHFRLCTFTRLSSLSRPAVHLVLHVAPDVSCKMKEVKQFTCNFKTPSLTYDASIKTPEELEAVVTGCAEDPPTVCRVGREPLRVFHSKTIDAFTDSLQQCLVTCLSCAC